MLPLGTVTPTATEEITFTPPEGVIPRGANEGDHFEAKVMLKVTSGGSVTILTINGVLMPGLDKPDLPPTGTFARVVAESIYGTGDPAYPD